jgi:cell division protein FtsB
MEKIKSLTSRLSWFPLLVGAGIVAVVFFPSLSQFLELREESKRFDAKICDAKMRRHTLEEEKALVENDDYYLEKLAREKLGLVKKGEVVYKIVPAVPQSE